MYAKARSRLRFEVRRAGRGRYEHHEATGPTDRLVHKLNQERAYLLTSCDWLSLEAMFAETPFPETQDLIRIIEEISAVSQRRGIRVERLIDPIIRDDGIYLMSDDDEHLKAAVDDLVAGGVLRRVTLRRRDRKKPGRRYSLVPELAAVTNIVREAFAQNTGEP